MEERQTRSNHRRAVLALFAALFIGSSSYAGEVLQTVSRLPTYGAARAVDVQDEVCYMGMTNGLAIWSTVDPADIRPLGFLETDRAVVDVVVDGDIAYIAIDRSEAWTVDVSDPAHPVKLGGVSGVIEWIVLHDNLLMAGGSSRIRFINVEDPGNPQILSDYRSRGIKAPVTFGTYAYFLVGNDELRALDLADPAELVGVWQLGSPAQEIVCVGEYLLIGGTFLTGGTKGPTIVYSLADPREPVLAGQWQLGEGVYNCRQFGSRVIADRRLTVFDPLIPGSGNEDTVLLDLEDPLAPRVIATLPEGGYGNWGMEGERVYRFGTSGLGVFDVSASGEPVKLGSVQTSRSYTSVQRVGSTLYAGTGAGFVTIEASDPEDPRIVGEWNLPSGWRMSGFVRNDTYIYAVASGRATDGSPIRTSRLWVVDTQDMNAPSTATELELLGTESSFIPKVLAISGDELYLASAIGNVQRYDISHPTQPFLRGFGSVRGSWHDMEVADGKLYICGFAGEDPFSSEPRGYLQIYDAEAFHLLGDAYFASNSTPSRILVRGDRAYVSSRWLRVFDLSEQKPVEIDQVAVPHVPVDMIMPFPGREVLVGLDQDQLYSLDLARPDPGIVRSERLRGPTNRNLLEPLLAGQGDGVWVGGLATGLRFIRLVSDLSQEERAADFDGNGRVGFPDFLLFAQTFGSRPSDNIWDARFDLDNSGRIDFGDFLVFVESFGHAGR